MIVLILGCESCEYKIKGDITKLCSQMNELHCIKRYVNAKQKYNTMFFSHWHKILLTIRQINNETDLREYSELSELEKTLLIESAMQVVYEDISTAKECHDIWMKIKIDQGYKYGEIKCDKEKTHPCMIPFEELSFLQKLKDELFVNMVRMYFLNEHVKYFD